MLYYVVMTTELMRVHKFIAVSL